MSNYALYDGREYMRVDVDGNISRPAINMSASGKWRVIGAARFNNFGQQVDFIPFPVCADIKDWTHKNGKAKWRIVDFDHGTHRIWGAMAKLWRVDA